MNNFYPSFRLVVQGKTFFQLVVVYLDWNFRNFVICNNFSDNKRTNE